MLLLFFGYIWLNAYGDAARAMEQQAPAGELDAPRTTEGGDALDAPSVDLFSGDGALSGKAQLRGAIEAAGESSKALVVKRDTHDPGSVLVPPIPRTGVPSHWTPTDVGPVGSPPVPPLPRTGVPSHWTPISVGRVRFLPLVLPAGVCLC